jgi:hypothetical protein
MIRTHNSQTSAQKHGEVMNKQRPEDNKLTYSNCKAAIFEGNPVTRQVISHGRSVFLDVLTAPPLAIPLCCFKRLTGCGVLPT